MSNKKKPWTTLDVQTAYENPWIKVTHRNVLNPAGKEGIYGVVHYKNIAIAIIPLDEHNNTWLVGQYRYTLNEYSWEIPEGGGPKDEPPLESAKRELLEETGLTAKTWKQIGRLHLSNSVTDEVALIFVAKDLTQGEAMPEETEELAIRKLPFEEVFNMAMQGEITDALAVSAIFKLKLLMDKGEL